MIFLPTKAGRHMPIDAETVEEGDLVYTPPKHMPHWTTCPERDQFKQKKPKA
jgi:hypothetical protein